MAMFEYTAITPLDRMMKGTVEAGSREQAHELLAQMQLTINSIDKAKPQKPKSSIGRNEFLLFNQQLASITKAGIPLEKGLRELSRDIASKPMRNLVTDIADDLEAGVAVEDAFTKREKYFPPLYGRILKAGIETGRLSEMLTNLNRHFEVAGMTRRIIFEAISYPAIIVTLTLIIATGIFLFIIPQFTGIYENMLEGMPLPFVTQLILDISANIGFIWVGIGVFIGIIAALYVAISSFPAGRRFKESIILRMPIIGKLHHSSILGKFSEAMSMMVAANCDMPTALRLSATTTGSEKILLESEILAGQIEKGANILEAGQSCAVIPKLFLYSVQLGAQRNELQDNLFSLSQMYSGQVRCWQGRLQAFFLPTMLILLGGFVGTIIAAVFLPIIQVIAGLS